MYLINRRKTLVIWLSIHDKVKTLANYLSLFVIDWRVVDCAVPTPKNEDSLHQESCVSDQT